MESSLKVRVLTTGPSSGKFLHTDLLPMARIVRKCTGLHRLPLGLGLGLRCYCFGDLQIQTRRILAVRTDARAIFVKQERRGQ